MVKHWKTIIRAKFGWMKPDAPPPSLPSVQFLANLDFFNEVLEAYCEGENVKWIGTLKGTSHEVAHAMTAGLSREAALFEVAKMQALLIDREQRATDIATAKRNYEMADLAHHAARREIAAHQKHVGSLIRAERERARQGRGEFAPTHDRDPNEPIILEPADFSAWDLN